MTRPAPSIGIADSLFSDFPNLFMSAFIVENIEAAKVERWLDTAPASIPADHLDDVAPFTSENLSQVPHIAAWRAAFGQQGLKPSRYRSSPEALAKSVLNGRDITTPIPLVNLYNRFSVSHLAPLGGYDLDRLPGANIVLRRADPQRDQFTPLGGKTEDMPLTPQIGVYAIDDTVLCWALNHRDSRDTCLQDGSTRAIFCTEAVDLVQRRASEAALGALHNTLFSLGCDVGPVASVDADTPLAHLHFPT